MILTWLLYSKVISSACALRYRNGVQQGGILSLCSTVIGTGVQQGGILSLCSMLQERVYVTGTEFSKVVSSACSMLQERVYVTGTFSKVVSSACALRYRKGSLLQECSASWYPQPVLYGYRNGSSAGWYPQPALQQPPDGRPDGGADGDGAMVPAYLHPHADRWGVQHVDQRHRAHRQHSNTASVQFIHVSK